MKKIFCVFFILFFIFSCWKEDVENLIESWSWKLNEKKWVVDDTRETINEYVDTLEWSIGDAKEVKDLYNQKANELQDELRNAGK
jgi:hypothetical protein